MIEGEEIFNYLEKNFKTFDKNESAYWRNMYANLGFDFSKVNMLGLGSSKPYNFWSQSYHNLFQLIFKYKFRKLKDFKIIYNLCKKYSKNINTVLDLNILRQGLTLCCIKENIKKDFNKEKINFLVIGDGFGTMTNLLAMLYPKNNVYLVNLSKTLFFDSFFLKKNLGKKKFYETVCLLNQSRKKYNQKKKIILIEAKNCELINSLNINVIINIASMQEMTKSSIKKYFDLFDQISKNQELYFYCCNRESKILDDGTVIKFNEYPWKKKYKIILDEYCPWMNFYYSKSYPFIHKYDGRIKHRLIKFND